MTSTPSAASDFVYTESLVAFIDVLGFSQMVDTEEPSDRIKDYFNSVNEIFDLLPKMFVHSEIKFSVGSDSMVVAISYPDELEVLRDFLQQVSNIQYILAQKNIWVRGGVAKGGLYFDPTKNFIFGPGLVRAASLEELAEVPRIIIDPQILYFQAMNRSEFAQKMNGKTTSYSVIFRPHVNGSFVGEFKLDDAIFLDYLSKMNQSDLKFTKTIYNHIRSHIYGSQVYFDKYRWLAAYALGTTNSHEMRDLFAKL